MAFTKNRINLKTQSSLTGTVQVRINTSVQMVLQAMISSHDVRETLAGIEAMAGVAHGLSEDDDLFDKGLCSFGSVQLMLALEERFNIEFPDHLLNRTSFATIRAIRGTVAALAQQPADA